MLRTYTFATPVTWGFGSLAAATAALIADLEPWSFYELNGQPATTEETVDYLAALVREGDLGFQPDPVRFCRTFDSSRVDEFRIELDDLGS